MTNANINVAMTLAVLLACGISAQAMVDGVAGPNFSLTAKSDYISTADGNSILIWGYANGGGIAQYPGPTLIVNQGDTVTVTLANQLDVPVSAVFPGQAGVTAEEAAAPSAAGLLTLEALPGGSVRYSFVAANPGTYLYWSGTRPELQIEMGLFGAMIIRPTMSGKAMDMHAYNTMDSMYQEETLFLMSEIDPQIHSLVESGRIAEVDNTTFNAMYFFFNGRAAPDTMAAANVNYLPTQPYNCMPMIHPGEKLLMRVANAGRIIHPFHFHGNNALQIARDGRLLSTNPSMGADLAVSHFTVQTPPGATEDLIFTWTGEKLGWDIYGHQHDLDNAPAGNFPGPEDVDHNKNGALDTVPLEPGEYEPDHGKPLPVTLPENQDLTFGGMHSGSPFLGALGALPPGEGGLNPSGGFMYMWHSHTEKELLNGDIFPGGMMTMLLVDAPWVPHSMDHGGKTAPKAQDKKETGNDK